MYKYLDAQLKQVKKRVRTEFNHLGVMGFDELNVITTKKLTQEMFDRLVADNEKTYQKAAKDSYSKAKKSAVAVGYKAKKDTTINLDWVLGVLLAYNLVTGYLYDREAERKRLRLNEQILTAREYSNRQMYDDSLRKTANLWWTQTTQYGIDIVDSATRQAFEDAGVKKVRWVSKLDGRECADCKTRHGKVFELSKVPSKTHYGCRCYLEPVK